MAKHVVAPRLSVATRKTGLFRVWVEEAETAYANLELALDRSIRSLRLEGVSDAEIFNRLKADLDARSDLFGTMKGEMERKQDDLFTASAQMESVVGLEEAERLVWALDPTVKQHCATCLARSGMEGMGFDEWAGLGLPGAGTTDCGAYCMCTLERE